VLTLKAIVLRRIGGSASLQLSEQPEPQPGFGEVRIQLSYAGINFAEIMSRKGLYGWAPKRPYILGMEGTGIIDRTGEGVDAARIGQRVVVGAQYGCYAQYIVVPAEQALPALPYLSAQENAAFLVNYLTAWVALMEVARIRADEKILITAAAGGVGTAGVQIAARFGSSTFGLAGSEEKLKLVRSLGAKAAYNYSEPDWIRQFQENVGGADVILEVVGGDIYKKTFSLLNVFGRLVVVGYASLDPKLWNPLSWWRTWRGIPRVDLMAAAVKSSGVMATHIGYLLRYKEHLFQVYGRLQHFMITHQIKPVISKVFPLKKAGEAQHFIESRMSTGKVLLKLSD
jgi:NADPH2:quinone reductase